MASAVITLMACSSVASAAAPGVVAFVPADAVIAVEIRGGADQVTAFESSGFWKQVNESAAHREVMQLPQYRQALMGLGFVQLVSGQDIWGNLRTALGDDCVAAVLPRAGTSPGVLFVARHHKAESQRRVEQILGKIQMVSGLVVDGQPDPNRTRMCGDVVIWPLGDDGGCQASSAGVLFIANDMSILERALKLAQKAVQEPGESLANSKMWRQATKDCPAHAAVVAAVDLGQLRQLAAKNDWPMELPNPLAALLFSDWTGVIGRSETATAWLTPKDRLLSLEVRLGEWKAAPAAQQSLVSCGLLPDGLAHVTLRRDFLKWWSSRERTMTDQAVAQFSEFAANMTTLFGGLDFVDEFLPKVKPQVQLVMSRQKFGNGSSPTPALPGFALVFRVNEAERIGPRLDSAVLSAMALINAQSGQQGGAQYVIDLAQHNGTQIIGTRFDELMNGSSQPMQRDIRYNFTPMLARVKDVVIVATSRELMTALIDRLSRVTVGGDDVTGVDELMINAVELARILKDNRELFVAQRMLEQDMPRRDAERHVDAILSIGDWFESLSVESAVDGAAARAKVNLVVTQPRVAVKPQAGPMRPRQAD